MIIELAGTSVEYIVEPLTEQLTASLEKGEDKVPVNCKYLLENCDLHLCQLHYEYLYGKLFDVLQELSDQTLENSKWVHQIYRKSTEAALKLAVFSESLNQLESVKRTAASAVSPNSIPNFFYSIDYKMSFDEVVDWLGTSPKVTNLIMFFEGLFKWMLTNNYVHASPYSRVISRFIEIKDKRGWTYIFENWLTMRGCESNDLIRVVRNNRRLCSDTFDNTKWISVSTLLTVNDITSIFEKETKLYFYITKPYAKVDKRNCYNEGNCGLVLKTVPAKDGANVVLCTDPADYPDSMHFHKEFQAKDMHLTAFITQPAFSFIPLSWHGTPIIKNNSVYWGESLSKSSNSKFYLHLFVCIA